MFRPPTAISLVDQNPSRHVRMKFAVIFNCPLSLEDRRLFGVDRDQDVPGTVARGGGMRNKIGIDPLDGIADVRRNFSRQKAELFHLHLNGVGARHTRHNDEKERAEHLEA